MGTRIELHLFGAVDADAVDAARDAIAAVDDALTIHRPSPAMALNARMADGRSVAIDDPLLFDALVAVDVAHAETGGLFDAAAACGGWGAVQFDRGRARLWTDRPVAVDFGGFGKGFALDHAAAALRDGGARSALLSAGESSILVIGEHPLGGGWPFAVPHPLDADAQLIEVEMTDAALSISSTIGSDRRAAMIRPGDGVTIDAPRTTLAIERTAAWAEVMSTALLVADARQAAALQAGGRRHRFEFGHDAPASGEDIRVFA